MIRNETWRVTKNVSWKKWLTFRMISCASLCLVSCRSLPCVAKCILAVVLIQPWRIRDVHYSAWFYLNYFPCVLHAPSQPVAAMVVLCWHTHPVSEAFGLTACCPLTFRGRNVYAPSTVRHSTPENMNCICSCLIGCQLDFDSIEQVHEQCPKLREHGVRPVMCYFSINRFIR